MIMIDESEVFKYKNLNTKYEKILESTIDTIDIPLNEMYFNESREMKELVKCIGKFRADFANKKITGNTKFSDNVNLKEFNRKIESFFGFKSFALSVSFANFINAWTFPIGNKMDVNPFEGKKNITITPTGYKFNGGDYSCLITITSKLMFSKEFTDRDIMGVILHEIGHSFSFALNGGQSIFAILNKAANINGLITLYIYTWILDKKTIDTLSIAYYNNEDNLITNLADHIKKQDNLLINLASIIMKPAAFICILFNVYINIISVPYRILYDLVFKHLNAINPISFICKMYGYKDEKIGDNFATIYGFGEEVAKFESSIYTMSHKHKSGFFKNLFSIIFIPLYLTSDLADPHPTTIRRCIDQIELLEKELEKEDLDESIKKQILLDIKATVREYKKLENDMDKYDSKGAKIYRKLMMRLFGGDFRELFINNDKFRNEYDEIK